MAVWGLESLELANIQKENPKAKCDIRSMWVDMPVKDYLPARCPRESLQ